MAFESGQDLTVFFYANPDQCQDLTPRLTMLDNLEIFSLLFTAAPALICFIFLVNVIAAIIFNILNSMLKFYEKF
jgi:hypothetical protein